MPIFVVFAPTVRNVHHAHAEGRRPARYRHADSAEACDAELLASEVHAEHEVERPALPVAAADHTLAFGNPAREGQNHRPGEISHSLCEHIGGIGDGDAA